jgi:hypothetical protein
LKSGKLVARATIKTRHPRTFLAAAVCAGRYPDLCKIAASATPSATITGGRVAIFRTFRRLATVHHTDTSATHGLYEGVILGKNRGVGRPWYRQTNEARVHTHCIRGRELRWREGDALVCRGPAGDVLFRNISDEQINSANLLCSGEGALVTRGRGVPAVMHANTL